MLFAKRGIASFVVVMSCIAVGLRPGVVLGQVVPEQATSEPSSSPSAVPITASSSGIVTRDSLASDLAEVRRSYRGQLEEYRQLHQQFIVAQQEFQQLNTLSSLESAVQATKNVTYKRDQVLHTYLTMLELELRSAEGVEVELKEAALIFLDETKKMMTRHMEDTQASNSRDAIATRANEFEEIVEPYEFTSEFVRQVLQLARIRAVQDKAHAILYELPVALPGNSQIANDQRLRALEQIDQKIQEVDVILDSVQLELEEQAGSGRSSRGGDDLEDAYVGMAQVLNYLVEVMNAAQV